MFTRKQYETIAHILASADRTTEEQDKTVEEIAYDLKDMFESDNPAFDPDKFIKACKF